MIIPDWLWVTTLLGGSLCTVSVVSLSLLCLRDTLFLLTCPVGVETMYDLGVAAC